MYLHSQKSYYIHFNDNVYKCDLDSKNIVITVFTISIKNQHLRFLEHMTYPVSILDNINSFPIIYKRPSLIKKNVIASLKNLLSVENGL